MPCPSLRAFGATPCFAPTQVFEHQTVEIKAMEDLFDELKQRGYVK